MPASTLLRIATLALALLPPSSVAAQSASQPGTGAPAEFPARVGQRVRIHGWMPRPEVSGTLLSISADSVAVRSADRGTVTVERRLLTQVDTSIGVGVEPGAWKAGAIGGAVLGGAVVFATVAAVGAATPCILCSDEQEKAQSGDAVRDGLKAGIFGAALGAVAGAHRSSRPRERWRPVWVSAARSISVAPRARGAAVGVRLAIR